MCARAAPSAALRCAAPRCAAPRCVALRCDALRCDALRCDALRCAASRCAALRYAAPALLACCAARLNAVAALLCCSVACCCLLSHTHTRRATRHSLALYLHRVLGDGKTVDSVWQHLAASRACGDLSSLDQLSAEEQQAQRFKQVLALLGIKTTAEDVRGCGEKGSADLLVQLAELVAAVAAPGDDAGPQRLLDAVCGAGGRLWSEAMQLFPRDMAPLLDEYGCARNAGRVLWWRLYLLYPKEL